MKSDAILLLLSYQIKNNQKLKIKKKNIDIDRISFQLLVMRG